MFRLSISTLLITTAVLCASGAIAEEFPQSRDPLKWPFSQDSIWNMPIGSGAQFKPQPVNPAHIDGIMVDLDIIVMAPNAPLMNVYGTDQLWSAGVTPMTRLLDHDGIVHLRLPIPRGYNTSQTYGTRPNNPCAILQPDGRTIVQLQPFQVSGPGGYATSGVRVSDSSQLLRSDDVDLYSKGIYGMHGGSGLSSLGGAIRVGELSPGSPPIRHALKISVPGAHYLYYDKQTKIGYRWPAKRHDSGAANNYRGTDPESKIGMLRAIPPGIDLDSLGLETEAGRKIAWTMQNYGAYQVEEIPWARCMIAVEDGPNGNVGDQFLIDYGYRMDTNSNRGGNPWHRDMLKIMAQWHIVINNGPNSIGGGGIPRQPLAPPFSSGVDAAPTIASQPQNRSVTVGQTATFSVSASGTPAPTYQWQRNGNAINGATAATYSTPATTLGDHGAIYRVDISNSIGSVTSNSATLSVTDTAPANQPPVLSFSSPLNGASFVQPANLVVVVAASDAGGSVANVKLYLDGTLVRQENVTPYEWGAGDAALNGLAVGSHVLRAVATDNLGAASETSITITVSGANAAPSVSAGPDRTITLPATASLDGTRSDDGLPVGATVTSTWSKVSGPGTVTFGSTTAVDTSASFSMAGTYVLRLTASDSVLSASDDVQVLVNAPAIPAGWSSQDLGTATPAGSALGDGDAWTIRGGGPDIWNQADGARFVWQSLAGDGDLVVRVVSQTNTNAWAKAGLMIRESSAAGSRHVSLFVTPGKGVSFQHRASTNGSSSHLAGPKVAAPTWLKLTRRGNVFTGWQSANGTTWTQVGSRTVAISASALVGLVVSSHSTTTVSTAVFAGFTALPVATN